jgi:hypothetical protein
MEKWHLFVRYRIRKAPHPEARPGPTPRLGLIRLIGTTGLPRPRAAVFSLFEQNLPSSTGALARFCAFEALHGD